MRMTALCTTSCSSLCIIGFGGARRRRVDELPIGRHSAVSGAETSVTGFGKFKVKKSPAPGGCNPATGATITIAAKLPFMPAEVIKTALN